MHARQRLLTGFIALVLISGAGAGGYYYLGHGRWSLLECIYMTVITLSTVGFREVVDVQNNPHTMVLTIFLILVGMGVLTFLVSSITAFVVEGELKNLIEERRMKKRIDALTDHYIICGAGATGRPIIEELLGTKRPCVVIERDPEVAVSLQRLGEVLWVEGDATEDEILQAAGIERAMGLMATLPSDKENLFLTLSARQLNPRLRIVARGGMASSREKFLRAGADAVVSPSTIGGMRIVSEMVRPKVVSFLDRMQRGHERAIRIEEVTLGGDSTLVGKRLDEARLPQHYRLSILAYQPTDSDRFEYTPSGDLVLAEGMTLLVLGEVGGVKELQKVARDRLFEEGLSSLPVDR